MAKYNIKGPGSQAPWGKGFPFLIPLRPPCGGNKKIYTFSTKRFGFMWGRGYISLPLCPTHYPYTCHIPISYILIFGYVSHTCSSVCHTWSSYLFPLSFTLLDTPTLSPYKHNVYIVVGSYLFSRTRSSYVITSCFPYPIPPNELFFIRLVLSTCFP